MAGVYWSGPADDKVVVYRADDLNLKGRLYLRGVCTIACGSSGLMDQDPRHFFHSLKVASVIVLPRDFRDAIAFL